MIVTKSVDGAITEGENVVLSCSSDANPPSSTFTWIKDDDILPGEVQQALQLTEITRGQAGYYRCRADNNVGTPSTSEKVDVIVHCKYILFVIFIVISRFLCNRELPTI